MTPYTYDFNDKEIHLVGKAFHKLYNLGQKLYSPSYIESVQNMLKEGLITLTLAEKQEKAKEGKICYIMKLTDKGREAWNNYSRKAAGLSPVSLQR